MSMHELDLEVGHNYAHDVLGVVRFLGWHPIEKTLMFETLERDGKMPASRMFTVPDAKQISRIERGEPVLWDEVRNRLPVVHERFGACMVVGVFPNNPHEVVICTDGGSLMHCTLEVLRHPLARKAPDPA